MTKFNHHVAVKVNRWGKGLLGDVVQIEEYEHIYFGQDDRMEDAYKLIDKLFRAGKREYIAISIYETGENVDTVRRLFVRLDYAFRHYGVADVAVCDSHGCYDSLMQMDAKSAKSEVYQILDDVAMKQRRSEDVA